MVCSATLKNKKNEKMTVILKSIIITPLELFIIEVNCPNEKMKTHNQKSCQFTKYFKIYYYYFSLKSIYMPVCMKI